MFFCGVKMQVKRIARFYNYLVHGLITAIIVVVGMLVMKSQLPPRLVKIDLVAITSHYTTLMMKETMGSNTLEKKEPFIDSNIRSSATLAPDNPAVKKISETIKSNLEPIISDYAKTHHVVIIQAQALVDSNVPDITNQIIDELDKKIK
jgi:hypothetical protein